MSRRTISSTVKEIILSRPSIMYCFLNGLINYSALARFLINDVKESLGKSEVNVNTVKVALIRLSNRLKKEYRKIEDKVLKILARSALRVETDLAVLTISKEYIQPKLGRLIYELRNARFLQLTQGINTYTIVLARELIDKVRDVLGVNTPIELIDNQSALILISPKEILTTPGFVTYVTSLLSWSGINITQIISCHLDTVLIIDSKDLIKAYTIIQAVVNTSRRLIRT